MDKGCIPRDTLDREDRRLVEDLARAMSAGRREAVDRAFEAIWQRHVRTVSLVAARYLREDADILSVTDDVFLRFLRAAPTLELTVSLRAYLAASAENAARDYRRARARREAHLVDPVLPSHDPHGEEGSMDRLSLIPDPDADVGASLRWRELMEELREVMDERSLQIVLAHAVWGESFPAIGARLGLKESTARSLYHRALHAFRRKKGGRL